MAIMDDVDAAKRMAAQSAAAVVQNGMTVGLGSGSTAAFVIEAIAKRVHEGLRITGVATSERTGEQAHRLGIALTELRRNLRIDLTIDGADEVDLHTLDLVKGRGGALLREKIVASASNRLVIVVDESKLVERLGQGPLPVEVVPFGWEVTAQRLINLGTTPSLRLDHDAKPYSSDGGHYILDCAVVNFTPATLADAFDRTIGVVEHGLFLGMTAQVIVGSTSGVRVLSQPAF